MFDFTNRETWILAISLIAAVVLGVWAAFGIAGYLPAANPMTLSLSLAGSAPLNSRRLSTGDHNVLCSKVNPASASRVPPIC